MKTSKVNVLNKELHLKQKTLLASFWISLFCHLVSRSTNFDESLYIDAWFFWRWLCRCFFSLLRSTLRPEQTTRQAQNSHIMGPGVMVTAKGAGFSPL